MNVLLVCPKSKGNTFNVCSYVANNSDAELLVINQSEVNDLKKYMSIILCSGVYGGEVHKDLLRWLNHIERTSIHKNAKIYVFLTWLGVGQSDKSAIRGVKNILEEKKMSLENDYMTCYGKGMIIIRYSHPNKEDCEKVLDWVKSKT
jgi:flavodoxin